LAKQEAEALVADVRVLGITFVRPGNAGDSDRLELTVENRGPAPARNIDVALKDTERGAQTNHLREVVEFLDEDSGGDRVGYFRIGEGGGSPPLSDFCPGTPSNSSSGTGHDFLRARRSVSRGKTGAVFR
jgi:hypothetical protein